MSERELRKLVSEPPPRGEWEDIKVWRDRLAKARAEALADEPDVVKVLRWLKSEEKYYTVNDDGSVTDFWGGLRYAQEQIQKQFHVRLTETDWEYVDE